MKLGQVGVGIVVAKGTGFGRHYKIEWRTRRPAYAVGVVAGGGGHYVGMEIVEAVTAAALETVATAAVVAAVYAPVGTVDGMVVAVGKSVAAVAAVAGVDIGGGDGDVAEVEVEAEAVADDEVAGRMAGGVSEE